MSLYLITRMAGAIIGATGPMPGTALECEARAIMHQIVAPTGTTYKCEFHRRRPLIEVQS